MKERIERLFGVRAAGSTPGREILGGLTTYLTMSYIIIVNPTLLADEQGAAMPHEGAVLATVLASAFATLLMAFVSNLPIALAPGMGLNAFFTYTVCKASDIPWQTGLGILLLVALVFVGLTVGRVRALITAAVPRTLRFSAAVGIGLFITFIGLQHAGIAVSHPATLVSLGDLSAPHTLLALGGLAVTLGLAAWRVRTALFWGVLFTAVAGYFSGLVSLGERWVQVPAGRLPGLDMDLAGALNPDFIPLGIVLLFFALFDAMGTLYAVGTEAGLVDERGDFPRLGRALTVDAAGALAGSAMGTSPVTCYIESATGVSVGARTGLANVVTGLCFLASLFLVPLVMAVGAGVTVSAEGGSQTYYPVTAPALILVGVLMARSVVRIEWGEMTEAVPAFLTMIIMPTTFNISHGLAAGFISYAGMKLVAGKFREVHWLVYAIALLFVWRYLYLGIPVGH